MEKEKVSWPALPDWWQNISAKTANSASARSDGAGDWPAPEPGRAGRHHRTLLRAQSSSEVGFHIDWGFRVVHCVQQLH